MGVEQFSAKLTLTKLLKANPLVPEFKSQERKQRKRLDSTFQESSPHTH